MAVNYLPTAGVGSTLTLTGSSTVSTFQVEGNSNSAYNSTLIFDGTMYLTAAAVPLQVGSNGDSTLIQNGGLLNTNGAGMLVGHGGSPTGPDGIFILNSGTTIAGNVEKWRGTSSGGIYLNGGVLETGAILNGGNNSFASLVGDDGVMNVFINGGTVENTSAGGNLFEDSVAGGLAARYDVNIEIGSGATINSNGLTTTSQRPLLNVTGSSAAGLLTVNGGGTLILTGTGSFTGTTLVNAGTTLKISRDGNLGVAPGSTVGNQLEINSGTLNFSSYLTGATLSSGLGATTSAPASGGIGVNNTTGALVVPNDGILSLTGGVGGSVTSGTVAVVISAPNLPGGVQATASIIVNNGTVAGYTITNPGSGYDTGVNFTLTASGGATAPSAPTVGSWEIAGAPVVLSEGIVNNGSTPTLSSFTGGSATLTTSSSVTLAASRGIQIDSGGATFDVSNYTGGFTAFVNGPVSGAGVLTKADTGELSLDASNSYQGGTIITGGTLQVGNTYALGAATGNLAINAGTLDLDGNSPTVGLLTGSSGVLILSSSNATATLTTNSATSGTYAGSIQNGAGIVGLTKGGSGTLTLSTSNSYSGGATINGGTLNYGNLFALGSGTATYSGNSTLQAGVAGTLANNFVINPGVTGTFDPQANAVTLSGAISGAGGLTKISAGTLTLSGSNSYGGGTTLAAGLLNFGNVYALGTGATTFSGNATLQAGGSGTVAGGIVINPSVTGTFDTQANAVTIGGAVSGAGALTKIGSGTLTLSSSDNYSGNTTLAAGTLDFGNAYALGTGTMTFLASSSLQAGVSGTVANNIVISPSVTGTFDSQAFSETLGGTVAGSGSLTKIGAGTLTLTGNDTYSGVTAIDNGILDVGSTNALGTSSTVTFLGGTLQYSAANQDDYSAVITSSTGAISIDTNGQSVTFNSPLASTNTGGLTKNGAGTLTLNDANLYTGNTTINSGTVQILNATALGAAGVDNLAVNGGTLYLDGTFAPATIGSLSGSSGGVITNGTNGSQATFVIRENQSSTFAGSFQNGSGAGGLVVSDQPTAGTSTLTISGSSTINGWSSNVGGGTNLTINLTGTINQVGANVSFDYASNNDATLVVNGGLLNLAGNNDSLLAGHTSGSTLADTVFILNSGTVIAPTVFRWRGSNTATLALNGGVLQTSDIYNRDQGVITNPYLDLLLNGGTIQVTAAGNIFDTVLTHNFNNGENAASAAYNMVVLIGTGGAFINTNGFNTTSLDTIANASGQVGILTKLGAGTLTLTGTNSYTGATTISAGTLALDYSQIATSGSSTLPSMISSGTTVNIASGATLSVIGRPNETASSSTWTTSTNATQNNSAGEPNQLTASGTTTAGLVVGQSVSGAGIPAGAYITEILNSTQFLINVNATAVGTPTITFGAATFATLNQNIGSLALTSGTGTVNLNVNGGSGVTMTVANGVTGPGALQETGNGLLLLSASGSYTGGTVISGGTLQIGNSQALGTGNIAVNNGTLDLYGNNLTVGGLSGSSTGIVTTSSNATPTLTVNTSGNTNFGGVIQNGAGQLGLTVGGTGTLNLSNLNTYTGATNINGGILEVSTYGAIGTSGSITFGGGTLQIVNNVADYSGKIVNSSSAVTFDIINATDELYHPIAASNTGGLTVLSSSANGVLELTGSQLFSGPTTIGYGGALWLGDGYTIDASLNNSSSITDNGSLVYQTYQSRNATVAISGSGTVTMEGTGFQELSASNSYTGGTVLSGGTLNFASPYALGTGPVTFTQPSTLQAGVSGTLPNSLGANTSITGTFDTQGYSVGLAGGLTGAGNIAKIGSGTLTIGGSSNETGTLFLDAGLVNLASAYALSASGAKLTFAGGALQYSSASSEDISSEIVNSGSAISIDTNGQNVTWGSALASTNTGGLTKNGAGTLTLNANNAYSGGTIINSGTVQLLNATALGAYGVNNLTLNAGALNLNGVSPAIGSLSGSSGSLITNGTNATQGTLTIQENQNSTFAGSFQNGSGGGLIVTIQATTPGTTLTLSGSSTIDGFSDNAANLPTNTGTTTTVILTGILNDLGSFQASVNNDATFIVNGGYLNAAGLIMSHASGGTVSGTDLILNSGTIITTYLDKYRPGASTTTALLNGGVLEAQAIYNYNEALVNSTLNYMNLVINGGTVEALGGGNNTLFEDGLQAAGFYSPNDVNVQIGAGGATINTNLITTTSQRPLNNVTGASTAGTLTVNGGGFLNLSGTGTFTGTTLVNGGSTLRISRDGNLGIAPGSAVANQVELNNGTLNFSAMIVSGTLTSGTGSTTAWSAGGSVDPSNGPYMAYSAGNLTNAPGALIAPDDGIGAITTGTGGTGLANGVGVTISAPNIPVGAGGIQATASAIITNGTLTGYTIINPGAGYTDPPTISLSASNGGTLPSVSSVSGSYTMVGNPFILDEGIVTNGATTPVAIYTGATFTLTTSTSVTLAATRGIQLDAGGGDLDVSNYAAGFTAFVNGPVSGFGALTKSSAGTLALDASNSYQGGTIITGGTVQTGNVYALGSGALAINAGTLDIDGNSPAAAGLSGSSGALITDSVASSSGTFTDTGAGTTTYAGQIQNGAGTVGLTQAGTGALTLSASSGFTGATNVNSGTLIVSGSLSGTPTVNVASNATLEVDGLLNHSASTTINGALQGIGSVGGFTASGGSINPGLTNANSQTSSGNLTAAGSVTLSNSTAFNIRLGMLASGTDSDSLTVTGANTISLNDATLNLTLGSYMNNPALQNKFYAIIIGGASGTGSGSDIFNGLTEGSNFTTANGWTFTIFYATNANDSVAEGLGGDVVLELDAIPEPGTWAAMLSGFAMLVLVQRARRRARH